MATPKLTKKTLSNLDQAELRCIARVGMKLPTLEAYTMKYKALVTWIYEKSEKFITVDVTGMPPENFRTGVKEYVSEVQGYLSGKREGAPSWPPLGIVEEDREEEQEKEARAISAPSLFLFSFDIA